MSLPIHSGLINSPSWYVSGIMDTFDWNYEAKSGIFFFGSRKQIYFLKVFENPGFSKTNYETKILYYMEAHHNNIAGLCSIPNGISIRFKDSKLSPKLTSVGRDKIIRIWSFDESAGCCCLKEFNIGSTKLQSIDPTCISINRDSNTILCGFERGSLLLWNYFNESEYKTFYTINEDIVQIVWNEQKFAIGCKNGTVLIYLMQSFDSISKLTQFHAHSSDVSNIAWNPNKANIESWGDLATAGKDRKVKLWKIDKNLNLKTLVLPSTWKKMSNEVSSSHEIDRKDSSSSSSGSNWLSLCWSSINGGSLIVSSGLGNIGMWRNTSSTELKYFTQNSHTRAHSKCVFELREFENNPGLLLSHSLDRLLNISRIHETARDAEYVLTIPCLGGPVLSLHSVDHSNQLAIGCSDNLIRLWRLDNVQSGLSDNNNNNRSVSTTAKRNSGTSGSELTNIWNGINGKILSLSWNPIREGLLAFGTDKGEVGCINFSKEKKQAVISKLLHRSKVFVTTWAVNIDDGSESGQTDRTSNTIVYSVGNYSLYAHDFRLHRYIDLSHLVNQNNTLSISDFAMHESQKYFAVGYGNGSVTVFATVSIDHSSIEPICHVQSHTKGINCMRWYPSLTDRYRLAVGSNERFITVTDFDSIISDYESSFESDNKWNAPIISENLAQLKGHGDRVTALSWNPFDLDRLVSASYDHTAIVWSVSSSAPLVSFICHQGKVFSCHWSLRDSDLIYTGGEDSNLFSWRPSQQITKVGMNRRRHYVPAVPGITNSNSTSNTLQTDTASTNNDQSSQIIVINENESNKIEDKQKPVDIKQSEKRLNYIKKRSSLFPTTLFSIPSSSESYYNGIIDFVNSNRSSNREYLPCLSIFDNRTQIIEQIERELIHHKFERNLDNYFLLLIWTAQVGRAVSESVSLGHTPDWLLAVLQAFHARDVPESLVSMFINNLVTTRKDPIMAAAHLVALGQSRRAVDLLDKHDCVREAIVLAKLRLPPSDPVIDTLFSHFRDKLYRNGNFELSAMCCLVSRDYSGLVQSLGRRSSRFADWVALQVLKAHEQTELAHHHAFQFVNNLLHSDHQDNSDINQWIDRIRSDSEFSFYSIIINFHRNMWIDRKNLSSIRAELLIDLNRYGEEKSAILQNQIQSKLMTKQINQSINQISVYITYETLMIVVSESDFSKFDPLNQLVHQYHSITLSGNQLIDQFVGPSGDNKEDNQDIQSLIDNLLRLKVD